MRSGQLRLILRDARAFTNLERLLTSRYSSRAGPCRVTCLVCAPRRPSPSACRPSHGPAHAGSDAARRAGCPWRGVRRTGGAVAGRCALGAWRVRRDPRPRLTELTAPRPKAGSGRSARRGARGAHCAASDETKGYTQGMRVVCFSTALRRLNEQERMLPCNSPSMSPSKSSIERWRRLRWLHQ